MKNIEHDLKSLLLSIFNHWKNKAMGLFEDTISLKILKRDTIAFSVVVDDTFKKLKGLSIEKVVVYLVEFCQASEESHLLILWDWVVFKLHQMRKKLRISLSETTDKP